MKAKATFITTLPSPLVLFQSFFNNVFSKRKLKVLILKPTAEKLRKLTVLAEDDLQIVVDKIYPVTEVKNAYKEARKGKITGKSVIVNS